ncbi:MAG: FmdB family zinc ribbon protein [Desulfobacterales bacterium]
MPLFDYLCLDCGKSSEILVFDSSDPLQCKACGSSSLKKLLSAHSSVSGPAKFSMPGPGDTSCCGSSPGEAGCAGPGSCCGKNQG